MKFNELKQKEEYLKKTAEVLGSPLDNVPNAIAKLQKELAEIDEELENLR